jgi:uncharacterized caspase-like protein
MMLRIGKTLLLFLFVVSLRATVAPAAEPTEHRIALVIGNAAYQTESLKTPANDAGLIAQTLQASGFDVVGARDLDSESLRHAFRDFIDKASASGPDTVAFVYFAGYGLQYEGENYIVPVDARIERDVDVPTQAMRVSDYVHPVAALSLKARIFVFDAARVNPFVKSGKPLAGGLAIADPEPGLLIAFNAAPGTVAPEGVGPYGPYAQALAEMIREGGLTLDDLFDRVRLRVNDDTQGAFVPWNASRVDTPFAFFERAADAPPPVISREEAIGRRSRPIRDFDAREAYLEALDRDTLQAYLDYLDAYADHPLSKRVRAIVATRREAITWHRTYREDTPDAYWSYLDRYPNGPHAWDARRRLRYLSAQIEPPPSFSPIEYDVAPPSPDEIDIVERRELLFADPDLGFEPPPRAPIFYLPPPPPDFIVLAPPIPVYEEFVLPVPVFVPIARWCEPPRYVAPPPDNVIFNNIHNKVVVNNTVNSTTISSATTQSNGHPASGDAVRSSAPSSPKLGSAVAAAAGAGVAAAALNVALPPTIAKKQALINTQGPARASTESESRQPLVGPNGQALPQPKTWRGARTTRAHSSPAPGSPPPAAASFDTEGQSLPSFPGKAPAHAISPPAAPQAAQSAPGQPSIAPTTGHAQGSRRTSLRARNSPPSQATSKSTIQGLSGQSVPAPTTAQSPSTQQQQVTPPSVYDNQKRAAQPDAPQLKVKGQRDHSAEQQRLREQQAAQEEARHQAQHQRELKAQQRQQALQAQQAQQKQQVLQAQQAQQKQQALKAQQAQQKQQALKAQQAQQRQQALQAQQSQQKQQALQAQQAQQRQQALQAQQAQQRQQALQAQQAQQKQQALQAQQAQQRQQALQAQQAQQRQQALQAQQAQQRQQALQAQQAQQRQQALQAQQAQQRQQALQAQQAQQRQQALQAQQAAERQKRIQQLREQRKCGVPGTPACPSG